MIIKRPLDYLKASILNHFQILFNYKKLKIYQGGNYKSRIRIISELYRWMIREGSFNAMYNAFGLNITGTKLDDFIGNREFLKIKDSAEKALCKKSGGIGIDHRIVTKDKFYATSIMLANGVPCIENILTIVNCKIINKNRQIFGIEEILNSARIFVLKNTMIEAGSGVFFCSVEGNKLIINGIEYNTDTLKKFIGNSKWVTQAVIKPALEIRNVNNSSLNITRIVTVNNGNEVIYIGGFQSFATEIHKNDSWDKGAIYVGFDEGNNSLKEDGFYHPKSGPLSIVKKHPDSGVIFEGYKINYLKDAVDLCIYAHHIFYQLFCIGWDVVLTDDGPRILEANEVPGLNAIQCIHGGIRRSLIKYSESCSGKK